MVERDREMDVIRGLLSSAKNGAGMLISVEGAPGMGKTELLDWGARVANKDTFEILRARGSELGQSFAFGVVSQIFEPILAKVSSGDREHLLAGAAESSMAAIRPGVETVEFGDYSILHGLYWLTANICDMRPLLIIIDDFHWIDPASLKYLGYLLSRLDSIRCGIIVASRKGASNLSYANSLLSDSLCTRLDLQPLTPRGAARVIEGTSSRRVTDSFAGACHLATKGNPLFIREIAFLLRDRGADPSNIDENGIVDFAASGIGRKVDSWIGQLGQDCREVASALSALGDGASITEIMSVADLDADRTMTAMESLVRAELVSAKRGDRSELVPEAYEFRHPLVAAAVQEEAGIERMIALHKKAAFHYESVQGDAGRVAAHLLQTPPNADMHTFDMLFLGAKESLAKKSPEAAFSYLQRCLQELDSGAESTKRKEVLWHLADLARELDMEKSAEYLNRILALEFDDLSRAETLLHLGWVYTLLLRGDEADTAFKEGLALAPQDSGIRKRIIAGLVHQPLMHPGRILSRPAEEELHSIAADRTAAGRELDGVLADAEGRTMSGSSVHRLHRALDDSDTVQSPIADTVLLQPHKSGSVWIAAIAYDPAWARKHLERELADARKHQSTGYVGLLRYFRSRAWWHEGQLGEAMEDLRAGMRLGKLSNSAIVPFLATPLMAEILIEQGEYGEAQLLLGADSAGEKEDLMAAKTPQTLSYFRLESQANLFRAQGCYSDGLRCALAAGNSFSAHAGGINPAWVDWRSEAALCLSALGKPDEANDLATKNLLLARQWGSIRVIGRAQRILGEVSRGEAGLKSLKDSVRTLEGSSAQLDYAWALYCTGAALRRSGARVESRNYLSKAVSLADRLEAKRLLSMALVELRIAGARPRSIALSGVESLTPSELRVAGMAKFGKSNREIAQEIFVTTKTVEVHLSSVYRKLAITGRSELADALASIRQRS